MRTVLVIDPSRVARTVVRRCLVAFSCHVVEAGDGKTGVAAARRERPALIVTCTSALAALRADPSCRGVPVVELLGVQRTDAPPAPRKGIAGQLVRPFSRRVFEATVTGVLGAPAITADEEAGCTVLRLPDARVTATGDLLESAIRTLAAGGRDTLILDLGRVTELNTELVAHIGRAIAAARGAGMRTGICAPDARVRQGLGQMPDTQGSPCEATRAAVRDRLGDAW